MDSWSQIKTIDSQMDEQINGWMTERFFLPIAGFTDRLTNRQKDR